MNRDSHYPIALKNLMRHLQRLPGIGRRSAERLAFQLLAWEDKDLQRFGHALENLKEKVLFCKVCGNLADSERCHICLSHKRNQSIICIVEQASQIPVIENSGGYNGLYHVLGGKLAPLEGKGPESLNLETLFHRLKDRDIKELIMATSPDVEGEATASYIAIECANYQVEITRIASGIPVGADLSFADSATMAMALSGRRPLS